MTRFRQAVVAVLIAVVSSLALYLFLRPEAPLIRVEMNITGGEGGYVEVFYTASPSEEFTPEQSSFHHLSSSDETVVMDLNKSNICGLRLDFEAPSGMIAVENFRLISGKDVLAPDFDDVNTHQVSLSKSPEGSITLIAAGEDPFIVFNCSLNIEPSGSASPSRWYLIVVFSLLVWALADSFLKRVYEQKTTLFEEGIFIVVTAVVMILPSLKTSNAESSELEKRKLAGHPQLFQEKEINNEYGRQFDAWFNDHFFLRNEMVVLYNKFQTAVIHPTEIGPIIIGHDNWLFMKSLLGCYNNSTLYSEEELSSTAAYLDAFSEWCSRHGICFCFLIAPDKEKVYGEYYPRGYLKIRSDWQSKTVQMIDYIRNHTDVVTVYPLNRMLQEKKKPGTSPLYLKYDTHWTYSGAWHACVDLLDSLSFKADVKPVIFEAETNYYNVYGDLSGMISNAIEPDSTLYSTYWPKGTKPTVAGSWKTDMQIETDNQEGELNAYIIHDSFGCIPVYNILSYSFRHIHTHEYQDYDIDQSDLEDILSQQTDVVILEIVERNLINLSTLEFPEN